MQAVILAAGMGRRFEPEPLDIPKCLLEVGGKSLLARSIENLQWAGCGAVTVVAGYRAELIEREIERLKSLLQVSVRYNSEYKGGSAGSVVCAGDVFENGATLMLDADLLYDRRILARVIHAPSENVIVVDGRAQETAKSECWLTAQDGRLLEMYRGTRRDPLAIGVYWGIHKFSREYGRVFTERARAMFLASPKTEYWDVVPLLFSDIVIGYVDLEELLLSEIDTWNDFEYAGRMMYPALAAGGQV